jgi:pimeloyl-ACP methyl ester carboxylesterase
MKAIRNRATRTRWCVLTIAAVMLIGTSALATEPVAASPQVLRIPVSFTVVNTNTSKLQCPTDGKSYVVRGHLVEPASALRDAGAVTLYLHGFDFGEWMWQFRPGTDYDFSYQLALSGHASVTLDRIGYGSSDKPPGLLSCIGGEADTVHQVITQLRAGDYGSSSGEHPSFRTVTLAGHSAGAPVAEIEAYSYHDIAGLVLMGWADAAATPFGVADALKATLFCATRGLVGNNNEGAPHPAPVDYAYEGPAADYVRAVFSSTPPDVINESLALRNPNACGEIVSVPDEVVLGLSWLRTIVVPVALFSGADDAAVSAAGVVRSRSSFSGSKDVEVTILDHTSHAVTLEAGRQELQRGLAAWLDARHL